MTSIYNCDGIEYMKSLNGDSIDLILTDPPYEINYKDGISAHPLPQILNDSPGLIDWHEFFSETYRILKPRKTLYIHCRTDMVIRLSEFIKKSKFKYVHDFAWNKGDMGYGNLNVMGTTHELIIALSKGNPEKSRPIVIDGKEKRRVPASYFGKTSSKEYYGHPTQKPVGLCCYIILNRTNEEDTVLDPFAGVGSTLVATKILNRNGIGTELDETIYSKALLRLDDVEHLKMYQKMISDGITRCNGSVKFKL